VKVSKQGKVRCALAIAIALASSAAHAAPRGRPQIIAHRGIYQQFDHEGLDRYTGCTASRIRSPVHPFLENTISSMKEAARLGADWIEIDVAPTSDGQVVVFHDWTLACRTDGKGEVRTHSLAELKKLDIGYGYTADGGKSFPFRGKGVGLMPTLEEVLRALPRQHLLINFKSKDPEEADAVAAAFKRAAVKIDARYGFYGGSDKVLERMRMLAPKAWIWTQVEACSRGYIKSGWSERVRAACRGGTIGVALDWRSRYAGWPNIFLDRMRAAGTRVVIAGDVGKGETPLGIERPEQLEQVPSGFDGYLWVEDLWALRGKVRR
jgi:glycerophosphoryl diester phosphodiesterase